MQFLPELSQLSYAASCHTALSNQWRNFLTAARLPLVE